MRTPWHRPTRVARVHAATPDPTSMPTVRLLLVLSVLLAGCSDQTAPPEGGDPGAVAALDGPFESVDEGASVAGFGAFRDSLRAVVARRDTAALLTVVAPGARLSFGDDAGGPEGVRAMWFEGTPPEGVPLWERLGGLLAAGSVDENGAVTVPYVFGAWPDSVDAFSHVAVVPAGGAPVEARSAPSDSAEVVATLRDLILPVEGRPSGGFQGVRHPDGRTVYVPADRAMSPVGWRATFFPDDAGAWKLQTLLAGD